MKKFFFDYAKEQHHFSDYRLYIVFYMTAIFFLILICRLFYLTHLTNFYKKREDRHVLKQDTSSWRYDIVDKNDQPLALSYRAFHIGMNPQHFQQLEQKQKELLAQILTLSDEEIEEFEDKRSFFYLRKHYELTSKDLSMLSKISFVEIEPLLMRYYPLQEAAAPLLGFTDNKGRGLEGLEFAFNDYLEQVKQEERVWVSPKGEKKYLSVRDFSSLPTLRLSLDNRIQQMLYEQLEQTYKEFDVESLSAVVLDPKSFSTLAAVSYPSFNPHHRPSYSQAYRLIPAEHVFEPGSVIKPFTLAFLAEKNPEIYEQIIQTSPGFFSVAGQLIRDIRDFGPLSFEDILRVSSNVAIAKLVLKYSQGELFDFWKQLSLINGSQIEFIPETFGDLPERIVKGSFSEALLGFGYGLQMNLFQLAQLYAVIAGDGSITSVTCLAQPISQRERQQIFQAQTVEKMRMYLKAPLQKNGTARRAFCQDISIAGKTGTVKKLNESGRYDNIYNSYFVSFFPVDNPKYVIAIYAENPKGTYYGGAVCAPMIKRLAKPLMSLPEY